MEIEFEKNSRNSLAFAYFITIRTYATWLHGSESGSVDPRHNAINTPVIKPSRALNQSMKLKANEATFLLEEEMRETVLHSMRKTCAHFKWTMLAIHVRTNHVHLILQSNTSKEKTMGKLKQYATKDLKRNHRELLTRHNFWSRHGSTRNIWAPETLFPALYYVVKSQGKPMSLYYDKRFYDPLDEAIYECYFNTN